MTFYLLGRHEDSVQVSQRVIDQRPDSFEAYQSLGHALHKLRRHAEAVEAYRRTAELQAR